MTYSSNPRLCSLCLAMLLSCLSIVGCSSSKTSVPLPFSTETSEKWLTTPSASKGSHVIELKARDSLSKLRGYATAFKTCGYSEKTSLRGASRQFFVGLEKLEIQSQGPIEIAPQQLWKVEAQALNEGFPIWLSSYTMKKDNCFIDFALWVPKPIDNGNAADLNSPEIESELREIRQHFFSLLGQMIAGIK